MSNSRICVMEISEDIRRLNLERQVIAEAIKNYNNCVSLISQNPTDKTFCAGHMLDADIGKLHLSGYVIKPSDGGFFVYKPN